MTKKLVIFGDSFAEGASEKSWSHRLAAQLNLPTVNFARIGSALSFSLIKFLEYTCSANYDQEDIIVFNTTVTNRVYVRSMPQDYIWRYGPMTDWMTRMMRRSEDACQKWERENFESAMWAAHNVYENSINYELTKTVSLLGNWAKVHRSNSVVILPGINATPLDKKLCENLISPDDNFLPLFSGNTDLLRVAHYEFRKESDSIKCMANGDGRVNHLSSVNHVCLSDMIYNVIIKNDVTKYNTNMFVGNIYDEYNAELIEKDAK